MTNSLAMEWAVLQDNILAKDDGVMGLTVNQMTFINILMGKALQDPKNRHDVLDLLFNPVCWQVTSFWLISSKNITSMMARLFLDTILETVYDEETGEPKSRKELSQIGKNLIGFLEDIVMNRNQLKGQLYQDRIEITSEGAYPLCAYCGKAIKDRSAAMHEAIITRGDIQKMEPELIDKIFTKENCVLVHQAKCHIEAQTKEGQSVVLLHILGYVSADEIATWINTLPFKSSLGQEALNKLKEAVNG